MTTNINPTQLSQEDIEYLLSFTQDSNIEIASERIAYLSKMALLERTGKMSLENYEKLSNINKYLKNNNFNIEANETTLKNIFENILISNSPKPESENKPSLFKKLLRRNKP